MKVQYYSLSVSPGARLRTWRSLLALLPVCAYLLATHGTFVPVDYLNLLIHEAGHLVFYPLGNVMHAAGGCLMQILLPAGLVCHFWRYSMRFSVQLSLLWLGQNYLNISMYVEDARAQALPLLYNRIHDWHHLLSRAGLLEYDRVFAYVFCVLGLLCFAVLLVMPMYVREDS